MRQDARAKLSTKKIQGLYDCLSYIYDLATQYEKGPHKIALEVAHPRDNFDILDVGVGTGKALVEFNKVTPRGKVYGLDISRRMLERGKRKIAHHGLTSRSHLAMGDAAHIPFRDASFDLVFSSYVLDLIDAPSIAIVLSEFKRLLRPSGRTVLVSLGKGRKWYDNMKLYEWVYKHCATLLGGCRPVTLMPYLRELGFKNVNERFIHAGGLMPTEIVWADKASE
jgi:ubiquinone/menaquinone biosynthesis C-methylase UbiE